MALLAESTGRSVVMENRMSDRLGNLSWLEYFFLNNVMCLFFSSVIVQIDPKKKRKSFMFSHLSAHPDFKEEATLAVNKQEVPVFSP